MIPAAEGVVGVGIAELGHRADVPRGELGDFLALLALLHRQVVQLFRHAVLGVPDLLPGPKRAAVQPENRDVAHVGLGHRLEHPAHHRRLDRRGDFRGRGKQLDHFGEQRPDPVLQLAAAAEQGHDLAGHHGLLHRGHHFVAGNAFPGQILLQQHVIGRRDRFGHLLGVAGKGLLIFGRDRHLFVFSGLGAGLEELAGLGEEIDDAAKREPVTDRNLHRKHLGREVLPDVVEDPFEIRVVLVHAGHEQDPRQMIVVAGRPAFLGSDFDAAHPRQHHDGGVGDGEAADHFAEEIEIARSIQQIDFDVHPLGQTHAKRDGVLAFDFIGGRIGEGAAFLDRAVTAARAGNEGEGVDQGGLAARTVTTFRIASGP